MRACHPFPCVPLLVASLLSTSASAVAQSSVWVVDEEWLQHGAYIEFPFFGCSTGGAGIQSAGTTRLIECETHGGEGGGSCSPGLDRVGTVIDARLPGLAMQVRSSLRPGGMLELSVHGPPNVEVWLRSSALPRVGSAPLLPYRGVPLVPLDLGLELLGMTDGVGDLDALRLQPELGTLAGARILFTQTLFLRRASAPASAGGFPQAWNAVLGAAAAVVTVDSP